MQASLIDVHCEATSEKMGMGHFCDGRASVVVGTHTHVPTGDAMIFRWHRLSIRRGHVWRLQQRDRHGKTEPMRRFITGMSKGRFTPAEGPATLSGLFVETDDRTGKAQVVKMIRHGGLLEASAP